ncbi:MAG TPA: MarR family transcriptional regulator [Verrucomicrobiales bacterium]|nr:MarR family transcriptional regulator [Verrucomicrobiales bacterium]
MENLSPAAQKFILHWGEMGARWGINRTVAQIHALLFLSKQPLHAEDICHRLGLARSNVSTSLRELQNWGIVKIVHLPGDRRDHFESMKNVAEMFRIIAAERKRREVDPTLTLLRASVLEADAQREDAYTRERLGEMLEFFELCSSFYEKTSRLPTGTMVKALRAGDRLFKALRTGK